MKNKVQRHQKQKQKKALKAQRREKSKVKYIPSKPKLKMNNLNAMPVDDQNFWYAHGLNYLMSDYQKGEWTPVFDGIYEGSIPAYDDILGHLVQTYGEGPEWTEEVKVAYAWLIQKASVIYAYSQVAEQQARALNPNCDPVAVAREPHNGHVWELFHTLKTEILKNQVKPVTVPQP